MSKVRKLYFAFGSNLSRARLNFSCPSAELKDVAKLDDYKLSFFGYSKRWHGACASIELSAGDYCWGAIWSISDEELVQLDKQECCHHKDGYTRVSVDVCTRDGGVVKCLTYEKTDKSQPGLPSVPYKETIVKGAVNCNLPQDYVSMLQAVEDNGYNGEVNLKDGL